MILYPPSYFLRPSRGSILLVLTDRALSDLFAASDKILPADQHEQQRSGTTHTQQYTAGKNIVKQNSTKHAKGTMHYRQEDFFFKKNIQEECQPEQLTRITLRSWYAALPLDERQKKSARFIYDTHQGLLTCSSGVLQSGLGLSLCV